MLRGGPRCQNGVTELADALAFLTENDRTVVATHRRDGSLQMSPVNSGVIDGGLVISSRNGLAKVANIRRDDRGPTRGHPDHPGAGVRPTD